MPISTIDQSGLAAPLALTSPTMTGAVVSNMASSVITSGTAVASTSGTSFDFTGIPSWVKRVTVMFAGVSTNGANGIIAQLGAGSVSTTSYLSSCGVISAGTVSSAIATTGLQFTYNAASVNAHSGSMIINLLGSNTWSFISTISVDGANTIYYGAGYKALGATLDRVRITTVGSTDTFDAGSINILYE